MEFLFFAFILMGVAIFHKYTLQIALAGLAIIIAYKLFFVAHFNLIEHLNLEWKGLLNLFGLLLGFAILAKHFQESKLPDKLPHYLPDDWKGPFLLLIMIMFISAFLDNIAAAIIGGSIAFVIFKEKVHIGYLVAIVAASNAGGAGSVLGDTTTTMMWINGIKATSVLHAYIAVIPAVLIFGIIASFQQDKYQRIMKDSLPGIHIDWKKLVVVFLILVGAILSNIYFNFPAIGVWLAISIGAFFTKTHWQEATKAISGALFLLALVLCASMMPVDQLPIASWQTTFGMGFISAVFDNIPLTKLALTQGGFDWGMLAYTVGFGGSMIWFGSSAGVALANMYPETKSVGAWIKNGWHVVLAYVIGFFIMLEVLGWHPQ